ncbi:MAG: hypothetical protein GY930_16565 [bacterium]|nr:hypothetical protein [bacterium]
MTDSNQPEGFEQHEPSGKKSKGPSMKERLIAQRKADAETAGGAKAPKAAPKPAAKKKTSAKKKAGIKPVTPVKRAAAPKAAAGDSEAAPARAASARRSGGSSRRRGAGAADGEGEEGGGRRGRKPSPEKNMTPIFAGVGVVIIAAAGFFFMRGGKKDTSAQEQNTENTADADADAAAAEKVADDQAAADADAAKEQAASDKAAADKAAADAEIAKAKAAEPKEPQGPPTEAPRNKKGMQKILAGEAGLKYPDELYDPSDEKEPQIATFELFGKPADCSEDDWATIEKKAALLADLESGAAGTRAAQALKNTYGKNAVPALINVLLRLDYADQEGQEAGDFVQRTLSGICAGRNADWRYDFDVEPNKAIILNCRTVNVWYGVWEKVLKDPPYWDRFTNTEAAKREKAGGNTTKPKKEASDEEANILDDLLDD